MASVDRPLAMMSELMDAGARSAAHGGRSVSSTMTRERPSAPEETIERLFGKKIRPPGMRPKTVSVSDASFVEELKTGSRAACEALAREHYARVYNFLFSLCGDDQQAQDLCQETFLKIWRNAGSFEGRSSILTWIFTIARNTFLDEARRKRPAIVEWDASTLEIADSAPAARDRLREKERAEAVREAVQGLPEREKTVIILRYREDLTFRQLAKVMGIPVGTAKVLCDPGAG